MPKTRVVSPARSHGDVATPKRKKPRGSRSVCSPALSTASGRLTSLIDQFKDQNRQSFALSPLNSRSVLNDNTDIEEPRRKSWWKKLDENSHAVLEVLEENKVTDANHLIEELIDIEVLSQEKKNFTLDLPESSDNESINSIVLPQRKLFTQKENQPQKKFGQLIGNRESLAKLHKANTTNIDKTVKVGTRELFQNVKRSKAIFPAALLQISPNKTAADKTKENLMVEPKPQVRNIFGNRPSNKRKNIFADFIVSESEDEIPDIQPKVFGFQKKLELRRISSISKGRDTSPTSSITTDIEMDDWKHLPSSTMVDNQLEDMLAGHTPVKRARLSKLSEAKESEVGTNTLQTNTTGDKTKQSNKSTTSKNKSKSSPDVKDKTLDNSRTTRSMAKNTSLREEIHNISRKQDPKANKSQNKTTKENAFDDSLSKPEDTDKQATLNKSQKQNLSRTRNRTKVTENESESDENLVRAINNETKIIRKSSLKNKSTIIANKSMNEQDIEINSEVNTDSKKIQDTSSKTGFNNVDENQEDDDEHNFTLQYENENDIAEDEAVVNESIALKKDDTDKNNKSLHQVQKPPKTSEESVESQQDQQNSAEDNVDSNQENYLEIDQKQESEVHENEDESKERNSDLIENELNNSEENEEVHEANISRKIKDDQKITSESQQIQNESEDEEGNVTAVYENEVNANEEAEVIANASDVDEKVDEADVSNINNDEPVASEEDEEEANASETDEEEANASENEEEPNESIEEEDEANESQEVESEVNESQEDANVNQSQGIEEEANEIHLVEDDDASDENNEEIEEDEEEKATNESLEVSANENQVESEADVSETEEVEHDQQMDDSDEADKAIATDAETSEQDDNDEMEVDDDEPEPHEDNDETEQNQAEQSEIEPSDEVIEESPDVTHDTTGRNRKKDLNESPEVILNNRTNQMDSFTTKGRNTSARKTKSMIKNLNIRPSLAPPRDSIGFSDGTTNSSAEGSGWDSHRTTRKTLRQTFGKDFTPRKSLRALVMEKSAKRQTEHIDLHSETVKFPQANSTEFPEDSNRDVEEIVESDHEVSRRTRQTTLETYLQKIKQQNIEQKLKMEEAVRNSLKGPARDSLSLFKVPNKPAPRRPKPTQNKQKKQVKSIIPFDELPSEVIADMKYKPPKRFQPTNASWITKRLYRFLENKLEPKYDYKARVRAEKLVETIYYFTKDLRRHVAAPADAVDVLKHELARLDIVHTHFEFYEFFHEFMPREIRVKVVPDIVNNIPLPRHGVFSEILRGVKG